MKCKFDYNSDCYSPILCGIGVLACKIKKTLSENRMDQESLKSEPMFQFFAYQHLPEKLQAISANFYSLAFIMITQLPRNPERTAGLQRERELIIIGLKTLRVQSEEIKKLLSRFEISNIYIGKAKQ